MLIPAESSSDHQRVRFINNMNRFKESSLRKHAPVASGPFLPYWPQASHYSSLVGSPLPDPNPAISLARNASTDPPAWTTLDADGLDGTASFLSEADYQSSPSLHVGGDTPTSLRSGYQQRNRADSLSSSSTRPSSRSTALDHKGGRSSRRPGITGAPSLVNGRYYCQWSHSGIVCGCQFATAEQLNIHIKSNHVAGAGGFMCAWAGCSKASFPTANKLMRHVHSHTGYKPFPCPHCHLAFVTKDQLAKHTTTHTGTKDFVCTWPGCGRSFAVKHALEGHVNSVHLKAKKHVCPFCLQPFDDSSNLSKHKKQIHNKETGIICPARHSHGCTYVDSRKDKMREHCEREGHGLETVNNSHKWSLWVQQFRSNSKRHDRRCHAHHRSISTSSASCQPYGSCPPYPAPSHLPSIECYKEDCALPVCLPCNLLCDESHDGIPDHELWQLCNELCHDPCDDPCDLTECHQPCDPCHSAHCDAATIQPCTVDPCKALPCHIPRCRSGSLTPSRPSTPHHDDGSESYFKINPIPGLGNDLFPSANDPSFSLDSARGSECPFLE